MRGAVIGAVGAVDARGAAELGDERHHGLAPGLAHVGFDRRDRAVERAEQLASRPLTRALVDMRVPAVERERADARSVRPREELRRRAGGLGEIGAHLRDAAALAAGGRAGFVASMPPARAIAARPMRSSSTRASVGSVWR